MTALTDGLAILLGAIAAVLTPLAIAAVDGADRDGRRAPALVWARRAAIPAGLAAAIAQWMTAGLAAALLTAPYAAVTALVGLHGARRILARGARPIAQFATDAGLVLLPGGALWLVAHRAGHPLLGYPPLWVGLTAAHFHVAGAFLPIVVGRAARDRGPIAGAVAIACVLAVPLTAAGIDGPRWLETAAALAMAASGGAAGVVLLTGRGALGRIAGAALIASMALAADYAARGTAPAFALPGLDPLTSMLVVHGAINVGAFATLGLCATIVAGPIAGHDRPPLSRLAGGWFIGPAFFPPHDVATPPRGLVDRLEDLGHAGLDAARVPASIRAFYERTAEHALVVHPSWRLGFRTGARLWARVARAIGQLQLPIASETGHEGITSRIVAIDPARDGRAAPRAWVRQFADGRALYVAAYATHTRDARAYMNIAFPLPGGSLTSILRVDHLGDGVRVSTRTGGDAGIWLVARVAGHTLPLRLPLSETIDVWTTDDPGAPAALRAWAPPGYTTIARHRLWLFGVRYLTLDYAMRPDR